MVKAVATLSDIVKATGAKPRSVQLWADAGVIRAENWTVREGSGRHRQFGDTELFVACIIAPFAREKMAIGGLELVAAGVRFFIEEHNVKWGIVQPALAGKGENYIIVITNRVGRTALFEVDLISSLDSNPGFFPYLKRHAKHGAKLSILPLNELFEPLRKQRLIKPLKELS
jgi:hypothetical protein